MNPTTDLDSNIPVLTEVISIDDDTKKDDKLQVKSESKSEVDLGQTQTELFNVELATQTTLDEACSLAQLEKTLHEKVLQQLLTRIDFVLEHRIKDGLAEVLENAANELAQDIQQGLAQSLEELIQRTISQEISKIQSSKHKST